MRAVFSWSYQRLSPAAARMFRTFGMYPGPDIAVPAAASLAGITQLAKTRPALAELGLVTSDHRTSSRADSPFHDLLRAYAIESSL